MHRRTADRILFYPILTQHIIDAPCSSTDAQYCNTVCIDNQVRCVKLMLCCTQHHHALMYRALPYAVAAVATVPYCTRACAMRIAHTRWWWCSQTWFRGCCTTNGRRMRDLTSPWVEVRRRILAQAEAERKDGVGSWTVGWYRMGWSQLKKPGVPVLV